MKKLENLQKNISSFWILLVSNLIPGICSAMILALIFLPAMSKTARKTDDAYEQTMLYSCASQMESLCSTISEITIQLENSTWIHPLYYNILNDVAAASSMKAEIRANLELSIARNPGTEAISFSFYNDPDTLYTDEGVFNNLDYYRENFPDKLQYRFFPSSGKPAFQTITFAEKRYLLYQAPFRDISGGRYKGDLNFFFDYDDVIEKLLTASEGKASAFRLLDSSDVILWEAHSDNSSEKCVSLSTALGSGDLFFEIDIPQSVHKGTSRSVMPLMSVAIAVDLLLCVFMAVLFSRFNYSPIQTILTKFGGTTSRESNEFEVLEQNIDRILTEKSETQTSLDRLRPLARQKILAGLLDGSAFLDSFDLDRLEYCNLSFNYSLFCVIAMEVPFSHLDNSQKDMPQVSELTMETILEHLRPMYSDFDAYLYYESTDQYRIILNYNQPSLSTSYLNQLYSICKQYFQKHALGESIFFGISNSVNSAEEIYRTTEQAVTAVNFSILNHLDRPVPFCDIASLVKYEYFYPISEETLLSRAIINCNPDSAKSFVHGIIENNQSYSQLSPRATWLLYIDLSSTVARSAQGLGITYYFHLQKEERITLNEIQDQLDQMIDEICSQIRICRNGNLSNIEASILAYIDDNICDPTLSLTSIAEKFNKSSTYISTIFKEQRGVNYNNYVNQARIRRAVELLQQANMDVNTVYPLVGYISASTFRRNFNKYAKRNPSDLLDS